MDFDYIPHPSEGKTTWKTWVSIAVYASIAVMVFIVITK